MAFSIPTARPFREQRRCCRWLPQVDGERWYRLGQCTRRQKRLQHHEKDWLWATW